MTRRTNGRYLRGLREIHPHSRRGTLSRRPSFLPWSGICSSIIAQSRLGNRGLLLTKMFVCATQTSRQVWPSAPLCPESRGLGIPAPPPSTGFAPGSPVLAELGFPLRTPVSRRIGKQSVQGHPSLEGAVLSGPQLASSARDRPSLAFALASRAKKLNHLRSLPKPKETLDSGSANPTPGP